MPEGGRRNPAPDPRPDPGLASIGRSLSVAAADGKTYSFPTLNDYVLALQEQGTVDDLPDLLENHKHLIGEIFFNWIWHGQLACFFAVKLSKKPRENGWVPIVEFGVLEDPELATRINSRLDAVVAASHEAAALIFPEVVKPTQIVELVNKLCSDKAGRWYRSEADFSPTDGDSQLIGLRWILPNGSHVNHVLGFADIPTMPITRRSPFTALFLRVQDHKRTEEKIEDGRVQVHLADLDSTFNPQAVHDVVSEKTKERRAAMVEHEKTARARARITFAVPAGLDVSLCPPRQVKSGK